jgi:VanZ family protein
MRARLSYELPALAYVVVVFVAGSLPMHSVGSGFTWSDKLVHALAFLIMQLLLVRMVRFELPRASAGAQQALAAIVAALLGALMELYQGALPHRSADLYDWFADLAGISLALLAALAFARRNLLAAPVRPSADSPSA